VNHPGALAEDDGEIGIPSITAKIDVNVRRGAIAREVRGAPRPSPLELEILEHDDADDRQSLLLLGTSIMSIRLRCRRSPARTAR